jgi:hypothetical protein
MKWMWASTFPNVDNTEEYVKFIKQRIDGVFFYEVFAGYDSFFPYILLLIFAVAIGYIIYRRKTVIAIFTILLVILHFTLSAYKVYPFYYRFTIYLLPAYYILIALGIAVSVQYLISRSYRILGVFILLYCCVFLLKRPIEVFPIWAREVKPTFDFINKNYPHTKIFVTTPLTLTQFYMETGYLRKGEVTPVGWSIPPVEYLTAVRDQKTNYLLLHSDNGGADGYSSVRDDLRNKGLVVNEFAHGSYAVWEVKPWIEQAVDTTQQK